MRVEGIRGQRFSYGDIYIYIFYFDSVFGPILVQFIWSGFGLILILLV